MCQRRPRPLGMGTPHVRQVTGWLLGSPSRVTRCCRIKLAIESAFTIGGWCIIAAPFPLPMSNWFGDAVAVALASEDILADRGAEGIAPLQIATELTCGFSPQVATRTKEPLRDPQSDSYVLV